jgi:hypothetical protein
VAGERLGQEGARAEDDTAGDTGSRRKSRRRRSGRACRPRGRSGCGMGKTYPHGRSMVIFHWPQLGRSGLVSLAHGPLSTPLYIDPTKY